MGSCCEQVFGGPLTTVTKILRDANATITARICAQALAKGDTAALASLAGAFGMRDTVALDEVHSRPASRHPSQDGPLSVTNPIFTVSGIRAPIVKGLVGRPGLEPRTNKLQRVAGISINPIRRP